jgi:hypothetical protein
VVLELMLDELITSMTIAAAVITVSATRWGGWSISPVGVTRGAQRVS